MECDDNIDSNVIVPVSTVYGILYIEFEVTNSPKWEKSWMILKLVVCLLGPSIKGLGWCNILVVDQKLFCNHCRWMWELMPRSSVLLRCLIKLEIWCGN